MSSSLALNPPIRWKRFESDMLSAAGRWLADRGAQVSTRTQTWPYFASPVSLVDRSVTAALSNLYDVRNEDAVHAFLASRPEAVALLYALPGALAPYFPGAPLALDLEHDDEEPANDTVLAATAYVDPPVDDALAALEGFEREWLLPHLPTGCNDVYFTLAFR